MLNKEPSQKDFALAEAKLVQAGFVFHYTIMTDDAYKPGVTNFGKFFVRENAVTTDKFWLNLKTIDKLPV